MIQRGDRARFALEPLSQGVVCGHIGSQHFYSDEAIQPGVAGFVHFPHAARTDRLEDSVRPYLDTGDDGYEQRLYVAC